MNMPILIAVFFGVLGVLSVAALYRSLDRRISKLEEANPKRINLRSLEELEHALAELAVYEIDIDLQKERLNNIRAHLAKAHTPTKK